MPQHINKKFIKITEMDSHYSNLEKKTIRQILKNINQEDKSVPFAVEKALPQIEKAIKKIVPKMKNGGRLFYLGAGTSGRLGIVDASECPPTFGVPQDMVIGLIAGGDGAIRKAIEFAEDDHEQGWKDLQEHKIGKSDVVIGIASSGTTPYVCGALKHCKKHHIQTILITCNHNCPASIYADIAIEIIVGPEFITGSTRMKAGTAQKLVLNMISTAVMIQLGRIKGNKMIDMQLNNNKLIDRGTRMVMNKLKISYMKANELLICYGSVRKVLEKAQN